MMTAYRLQTLKLLLTALLCACLLAACQDSGQDAVTEEAPTSDVAEVVVPTDTPGVTEAPVVVDPTPAEPTANRFDSAEFITIAMDVPDRSGLFADFDEFGNVLGLDPDMLAEVATEAGLETELIVTRFDGMLEAVGAGEFGAAMSRIDVAESAPEGVVFTEPYFEVSQVLMVRANETELQSWRDISADMPIAVVANSAGAEAASDFLNLDTVQMLEVESTSAALQLLSDFGVRAAIVDSHDASAYAERYYQRLRLLNDESVSQQRYVLAVAAENKQLLGRLNAAIVAARESGGDTRAAAKWLVDTTPIRAGDSLIGTPADRLLIGVVGDVESLDPASDGYAPLDWEVRQNTMSGLLGYNADNQLVAVLAAELPEISADRLQYTFTLRDGVAFADGTALTADAVKLSLQRVAATANAHFSLLKDTNLDGFADEDAIEIVDERSIRFVLDEPDSTFLSRMATPAYAIVNPRCDLSNYDPTLDSCAGIGPYRLTGYEPRFAVRMEANASWIFAPPSMEKVELRLYRNSDELNRALASGAVDVAWLGLNDDDGSELRDRSGITTWAGTGIFKSYMVFEQGEEGESPWSDVRLRQAAALAVDREAIAQDVFSGTRRALYSPLVDGLPGQISAEPQRNLDEAINLLQAAGYSSLNKLEIDIWYLNDGRYTDLEEAYAQALEAQLEETEIFDVTLNGEGWGVYSGQMSSCNYPAFLLGWPPSSRLPYMEGMNWIAHFVYNAAVVCSNYESEQMIALLDLLFETVEPAARTALYAEIQELWAQEYPTLDLYQQTQDALSLNKVTALKIDGLGMLRYDTIEKPQQ